MTDSKRTIQLRKRDGTAEEKAWAGTVKSRRYQPTEPSMLACERSPALNELGTVTGAHPSVPGVVRQ